MHLTYSLQIAHYLRGAKHVQDVMKELGITYQHATPQSLGDCWWFFNCEGNTNALPPFLSELKIEDPFELVGFGLSKTQAQAIKYYQLNKQ